MESIIVWDFESIINCLDLLSLFCTYMTFIVKVEIVNKLCITMWNSYISTFVSGSPVVIGAAVAAVQHQKFDSL